MPVEIRELVIRAVTTLETDEVETEPETEHPSSEQEDIIRECVRQVMQILKKKEER
jgi:hypothetical protein